MINMIKNPVNEALGMQKVLKQVGLFFYAGHGMQIKGDNYFIPTSAHITSETDVKYSAVNADRVLGKMEGAGTEFVWVKGGCYQMGQTNAANVKTCRRNKFFFGKY